MCVGLIFVFIYIFAQRFKYAPFADGNAREETSMSSVESPDGNKTHCNGGTQGGEFLMFIVLVSKVSHKQGLGEEAMSSWLHPPRRSDKPDRMSMTTWACIEESWRIANSLAACVVESEIAHTTRTSEHQKPLLLQRWS